MVNPQQKSKSIKQLSSRSASEGIVFLALGSFGFGAAGVDGSAPSSSESSSSSSSSSMTNCEGSSLTGVSSTSSFFQRTSNSNRVVSPSISNTTGSTRWSTRTQFSTRFVVVFSGVCVLMNVARDATEADAGVGNVWSEIRLKSREQMTRIRVATFSGASCNALRTLHNQPWVAVGEFPTRLTVVWGDEGENIRGGVEESDVLESLCYPEGRVDAKGANLIPVRVCGWNILCCIRS